MINNIRHYFFYLFLYHTFKRRRKIIWPLGSDSGEENMADGDTDEKNS